MKDAELAHLQFPLSRGIARQYADAMIANGKLDEADAFLRDQVQLYREEPKLHDLLAKTYAAQGKITLQHMALAESYALAGQRAGRARPADHRAQGEGCVVLRPGADRCARTRAGRRKRREEIEEAKK